MQIQRFLLRFSSYALGMAVVVLMLYGLPRLLSTVSPQGQSQPLFGYTVKARVVAILEQGEVALGERIQPYQILRVTPLEGPWAGQEFEIDYGKRQLRPAGSLVRVGEQILVMVSQAPGGVAQAYFVDFVRTQSLVWLLAAFVIGTVLLSGWKGVRSLLAMGFSLLVILLYVLPRIMSGEDPVAVSVAGAFAILTITLYLVYGWTLKTHAAVVGMLLALVITGLLAVYFVDLTRLTGFGNEAAMFLSDQVTVDLRGLVLGGILIGALGVLDDLVITQASAVFELHAANPALRFGELYARAMRIGRDHVAATVNTLVLAYAGAALPLLLLVSLSGEQIVNFLNREFVTEEIVRTLVGSLGLISAVPITTGLACLVALQQARLGRLGRYLGPAGLENPHGHPH